MTHEYEFRTYRLDYEKDKFMDYDDHSVETDIRSYCSQGWEFNEWKLSAQGDRIVILFTRSK